MERKSEKVGHRACGREGLCKRNSFRFVRSHFKGEEEHEGEAMKKGNETGRTLMAELYSTNLWLTGAPTQPLHSVSECNSDALLTPSMSEYNPRLEYLDSHHAMARRSDMGRPLSTEQREVCSGSGSWPPTHKPCAVPYTNIGPPPLLNFPAPGTTYLTSRLMALGMPHDGIYHSSLPREGDWLVCGSIRHS